MKHPADPPFSESKISATFLEFATPILGNESGSLTANEIERILSVAFVVWNAVVYDKVHGDTEWVTRLRKQAGQDAQLLVLIDDLIARKQTQFGHDLRLVGKYEIVENNGEWRLRVEARSPTETADRTADARLKGRN